MNDMSAPNTTEVAYKPRRLSAIILALAQTAKGPVTIEQIRDALGDRSFAALLAVFSIINLLPFPPGAAYTCPEPRFATYSLVPSRLG